MSRRKHKATYVSTPPLSAARVEKALREQRTQQALELAKALHKQDPTADHLDLLKRAYLARSRDLAAHGHTREAADVLMHAATIDSHPVFIADVACELAHAGDVVRALQLRSQLTDPEAQSRVLALAADEALRCGPSARRLLPEELREPFDAVLAAFAHAEKGEDDAARERLNAIGLRSPFLEWKLLLRGLLAYYAGDDARALENWQRLDPQRWPFRLASPFRFVLDSAFARSQPVETQNALRRAANTLQATPLIQQLRQLQAALANERQLPQAFRQAEQVLPVLRAQAPHLVPRLASCFYWAIIHHGMPEDMGRYRRVFGVPPDDPGLSRLEALALEYRGNLESAHKFWQQFEKHVASSPAWPDAQKKPARALIWWHMGKNAASLEMPELQDDEFPLPHVRPPRPLKPSAEECFEKSIELYPDQRDAYEALFDHHLRRGEAKKAERTGRRLLEKFPDHVPTLERLGDLLMEQEKYAAALELFQQALRANPLEQRLRSKVSNAYAYHARQLADGGHFEAAREAYRSALTMDDRSEKYSILCKWAACEFKAGNPARGEELLAEALSEKGNRLAVVFSMLIETIRFKLTKLKPRFNDEFNRLLAEPPTGAAAAALAVTAADHHAAGVSYHGQQTHEKKVLTYLDKARMADFTEQQLRQVCAALAVLKKPPLHLRFVRLGQSRFPESPYFYLAEAQYEVNLGPYRCSRWRLSAVLEKARQLAQAMPRGDEQQQILTTIQQLEALTGYLNPFHNIFERMFGELDFEDDDYEKR